jgi:hydrogenase-4 component B
MIAAGFLGGLAALGAAALLAVVWPSARGARWLAAAGTALGGAGVAAAAGQALAEGGPWTWSAGAVLRPLGGFALRLDALSAFFVGLTGLCAVPVAVYAAGYLAGLDGRGRGRAVSGLLPLFVAGMATVAAADNVFTFLLAWESMAVSSYLLVVSDADSADARAAGLWYAAMTHAGFLALLVAFLVLAGGGPLDFAALRARGAGLAPVERGTVFLLALAAFGSKAGLVPLHVWLPRAHPAAPSPVSALMSAVMVKLGVYGFVRVAFDLLPPGPVWWGGAVLVAGLFTALAGVLYSVIDQHLKRVLAYSTIENVGLVFVGLGFSLLMRGHGQPGLAAAALAAALLHVLNHACFKTLLFLGAGAMIHGVGTPSLEAYGGLVRRMPATAALFFVGCLALAALPSLNGFPSEWLTFQLLVAGARGVVPQLAVLLPLAVAGVALAAGLAAVSAVRLFGMTCLALPRSPEAAAAHEAGAAMRWGMALPAASALALGLLPAPALALTAGVAASLGLPFAAPASGLTLAVPGVTTRLWPLGLAGLVAVGGLGALALLRANGFRRERIRVGDAWNCGRLGQSPRMEYTAASFAEPLKRVFAAFYQPTHELRIDAHPASQYFVQAIEYRGRLTPWLEHVLYEPLVAATIWTSRHVRRLQAGSLHVYLAYMTVALLALLVLSSWIAP